MPRIDRVRGFALPWETKSAVLAHNGYTRLMKEAEIYGVRSYWTLATFGWLSRIRWAMRSSRSKGGREET